MEGVGGRKGRAQHTEGRVTQTQIIDGSQPEQGESRWDQCTQSTAHERGTPVSGASHRAPEITAQKVIFVMSFGASA